MDYSQLPEDIVLKIARDHLETFSQLLAFSHVSKSWRSAALDGGRSNPCFPGLLVTERDSDEHQFVPLAMFDAFINTRTGEDQFNTTTSIVPAGSRQLPRVTIPLGPDAIPIDDSDYNIRRNNPCLASKDGWVLLIQPGPVKLYLLNPITRATIALPLFRPDLLASVGHKFYVNPADYVKAVISSSPDGEEDCYVFVILHPERLAWCKVGREGQSWKFTDLPPGYFPVSDATYFGGKLYMLGFDSVRAFDHRHSTTILREFSLSPAMTSLITYSHNHLNTFLHLCHLGGHLLVIVGILSADVAFHVFKLVKLPDDVETNNGDYCWEEVSSLDGHAIFLGYSHPSVCLPAATPFSHGVNADRIYFAYCYYYGYFDLDYWDDMGCNWYRNSCGVFNFADQKLESLAARDAHNQNYFWFLPMPWDICKHTKHKAISVHHWERLLVQTGRDSNTNNNSTSNVAEDMISTTQREAPCGKNKTNKKNRQQRSSSNHVATVCKNRFEALSLADDHQEE